MLVGLAASLNAVTFAVAARMGRLIEGTTIVLEASLDASAAPGPLPARPGLHAVNATIAVVTNASPEEVELLRVAVAAGCPVRDNLTMATPVAVAMHDTL